MMSAMGNLTLVVVALPYHGQLNLTATADRDRCSPRPGCHPMSGLSLIVSVVIITVT
jgi:hypothetical protein